MDLGRAVDKVMSDVVGDIHWTEEAYVTEEDSDTSNAVTTDLELGA